MRGRLRALVALVSAAVLASGALAGTAGAAPAGGNAGGSLGGAGYGSDARIPAPVLSWAPCDADFECARAQVPADYRAPRGARLTLGLIRMPAKDPQRRVGTLFLGTGVISGTSFVRAAGPSLPGELLERFDVVGVDQRGTGTSEPAMRCSTYEQDREIELPLVADHSGARDQFVGQARALNDLCVERSGPLLAQLGTTAAARDLDLLRRAVGDARLNYLGLDYGTLLGQYYAAMFPGRVRTMALDGVQSADRSVRDPLRLDREMFAAAEAGLETFFAWCRADPARCGFGAGGDAEVSFDALVRRLDGNLTEHPGRHDLVTGGVLMGEAYQALAEPALWPAFGRRLAALQAEPLPTRALPTGENDVLAGYLGNMCVDQETPGDLAVHDRHVRKAVRVAPRIGRFGGYAQVKCGIWPVDVPHFRGPWRYQGEVPLLLVSNSDDPYSPRAWARKIAADTGNARVLDVRGYGHTAFGRSDCATRAVTEYLTEKRLPGRGTTCELPLPA